jgi:hypothetical protein
MKWLLFWLILAIGAVLGYLPSVVGAWGWGAGLVTMFFGVVVAVPIAGLVTGIGKQSRRFNTWRGAGFSGTTGLASDGVVRPHRWYR